jgi:hypothetical protein
MSLTLSGLSPFVGSSVNPTTVTVTGLDLDVGTPGSLTLIIDVGGVNYSVPVTPSDASTGTCTIPGRVAAGLAIGPQYDCRLHDSTGNSNTVAKAWEYLPLPTLASIVPNSGPSSGGTTVTLTGTGFSSDSIVLFDATPATSVNVGSETEITCDAPAHAEGPVSVTVSNVNGTAELEAGLAYLYTASAGGPLPTVASIAPTAGPSAGGTPCIIAGLNYQDPGAGTTTVSFGAVPATGVVVTSNTRISCNSPAGTPGATVSVTVTNDNGSGSKSNAYTYRDLGPSYRPILLIFPKDDNEEKDLLGY